MADDRQLTTGCALTLALLVSIVILALGLAIAERIGP